MWKKISLPKLGIDRSLLSDNGQKLHIQCYGAKQIQQQQQKKEKREREWGNRHRVKSGQVLKNKNVTKCQKNRIGSN